MPLNRPPLSESDISLIDDWIDQGAKGMAGERPGVAPSQTHWAFVPPTRPALPSVPNPGRARNPIDRFVMARLDRERLAPSPEAERATLLRRVSLDLVGLPPTPDEVDAFLADRSQDAYERVVDRLLASPHFGERWAPPLARPGSLRRLQRLQHRRPALDLEVPRLGHRRFQRRPAVRPVHDRSDRRRSRA